MSQDIQKHHRKSMRLKGYDYTQAGAYFVTICVNDRRHLLGKIANGEMILNDGGEMVEKWWIELTNKFPDIELDFYVTMPNHFHDIIILTEENVGAPLVGAQRESKESTNREKAGTRPAPTNRSFHLSQIVGEFKSLTTNEYISGVKNKNWQRFIKKFWQRNYYEHIIRNEWDLNRIRKYIYYNPLKWEYDRENDNHIPLEEKKKFWDEFLTSSGETY